MSNTTCNDMLEAMLEADIEELEGRSETVVARHVRACAKCRAVAQRLVADSRLLARVVLSDGVADLPSYARRRHGVRPVFVGGVAVTIAASVVFMVFEQAPGAPAIPPMHAPVAHAPVARVVEPKRFAGAVPVVPVKFDVPEVVVDTTPPATDTAVVSVTPPPGRHAMVWRGHNPKITVVWLY